MQHAYKVFIYTALACEAKPLVAFFGLKKQLAVTAFAVYANEGICLTVTGCGKAAMAAGVAYSQALFADGGEAILLNLGVAGHTQQAIGTVLLADKIIDADSGRCFYPPLVFTPPCATELLRTASVPQVDYSLPGLYDMEASAFYETASRFTCAELIQCLKVVSDNQEANLTSPDAHLAAKQVAALLAGQIVVVEALVASLRQLASQLPAASLAIGQYPAWLSAYRFTAAESQQLQKLLAGLAVVGQPLPDVADGQFANGKAVLAWLRQQRDAGEFYL